MYNVQWKKNDTDKFLANFQKNLSHKMTINLYSIVKVYSTKHVIHNLNIQYTTYLKAIKH